MLTLPVHTRTIAVLQYDMANGVLWARLRDGRTRVVKNLPISAVFGMICKLPEEPSIYLRTLN
jgi:hypothetical protein